MESDTREVQTYKYQQHRTHLTTKPQPPYKTFSADTVTIIGLLLTLRKQMLTAMNVLWTRTR